MSSKVTKIVRACAVAGAAVLSGCTTTTPPPSSPPPAPVVQASFPSRPVAPGYAQDNLTVPAVDAMGIRQTVNAGLTSAQTIWNLRSAYNVAALNCLDPEHQVMAERYGRFLQTHDRELAATNRALDTEFRRKYGPGYKDVRDRYMTQVYNYFALPPALPKFCDAAFEVSSDLMSVRKGELDLAASVELPKLETVFLNFFSEYEAYSIAAAEWDASYLATYGVPYRRRMRNGIVAPYGPGAPATGGMATGHAGSITAPMPADGSGN